MPYSPESLLQLLQKVVKRASQVREIHALVITNGHFLCRTEWKNTLLYNALIRAHLCFDQPHESVRLFADMLARHAPPNSHTFSSLLKAVSRSSSFPLGPPLHAQALRRGVAGDPFVATSFLALYAGTGVLGDARKVFDEMPQRCVVACNAMIDGLCKNGDVGSALSLFRNMPERDVVTWTSLVNGLAASSRFAEAVELFSAMLRSPSAEPNEATYVGLIGCCVGLGGYGGLGLGKQVHGLMVKTEASLTVNAGTALIDFYGKNGLTKYASSVFDQMPARKTCAWNAAIAALASNGQEQEALTLFDRMRTEGFRPNEVTFVVVLTACAWGRLVELGLGLFRSMLVDFGVVPVMEHYGCVVDMLGRSGLVAEAGEFVKRMPFEPDGSVLGALLGACKIHGATELGDQVGRKLIERQRKCSGRHVVLSNINASAQRWDRAADLRNEMVDSGVEKIPAYSMVV